MSRTITRSRSSSPASTRRLSTTRRTSPFPPAPTSPRSRSIATPGSRPSSASDLNYPIEELEPGLDETAFYDPKNFTFPSGAHIAEIEIDRDTGVTTVVRFTASDDFGRIINPMIVEGQVHGGLAQGIGQALFENALYDKASGQLL